MLDTVHNSRACSCINMFLEGLVIIGITDIIIQMVF